MHTDTRTHTHTDTHRHTHTDTHTHTHTHTHTYTRNFDDISFHQYYSDDDQSTITKRSSDKDKVCTHGIDRQTRRPNFSNRVT